MRAIVIGGGFGEMASALRLRARAIKLACWNGVNH